MAKGDRGGIPTAPTGPKPGNAGTLPGTSAPAPKTNTSGKGGSSGGGKGKGGGKGGGKGDPNDPGGYRRKAGQRYLRQAANLEAQAQALQRALNKEFKGALRTKLRNVNRVLRVQQRALADGYLDRLGSLEGAVEDNESAAVTQTQLNEQNRARERANAISEATLQGAGESDLLNAQLMSLRNWQANQSEVQRNYFDTLRSVNSSLTDLTVDTRTGFINNATQAQADKEQLWTNYYNQRSEAFTNLGNIRGQQADYREMAREMGVGGGGSTKAMRRAYNMAAKTAGQAWENPGVAKRLRNWQGADEFEPMNTPGPRGFARSERVDLGKKPEGATLRKW